MRRPFLEQRLCHVGSCRANDEEVKRMGAVPWGGRLVADYLLDHR